MSKKVERMKSPVKFGRASVRYVWSMDGEKLSLSQAADYCDATYSPMHYAWKMAVKDGRTRFICKGLTFSLVPVEAVIQDPEPKQRDRPHMTPSGRPLLLRRGYETHGLGRTRR